MDFLEVEHNPSVRAVLYFYLLAEEASYMKAEDSAECHTEAEAAEDATIAAAAMAFPSSAGPAGGGGAPC